MADLDNFDCFDRVMGLHLSLFSKFSLDHKKAEEIIILYNNFIKNSLQFLGKQIQNCDNKENIIEVFNKTGYEITNTAEQLSTECKLITTCRRRGLYADPSTFRIKEKTVQIMREMVTEKADGVVMPIEWQIKKFLELPDIFTTILRNQEALEKKVTYENMVNGNIWKDIKKKDQEKIVIPISI